MIVIGVLLTIVELGLFGRVLFTLAIYALPVFVGLTRRSIQFKLEQDPFGAIIVGFVADGTTLVSGQCAVSVALLHRPLSRWIAIGACCDTCRPWCDPRVSSYRCFPSEWWPEAFAVVGAIIPGWNRLGACR